MDAVHPIVLAAGASARMGEPKALLRFDGETCLSLVLRACREGGAARPIVVLGHDAEPIRSALEPDVVACVNAAHRTSGPAGSLRVGLDRLPADAGAILLFPVDFPLVTGREIAALIQRWRAARPRGARIVIPSHEMRRGHPALFDREMLPILAALDPDAPLHEVARAHAAAVEHVVMEEPWVLMDMDTPADYRRCLAAYRRRRR
jgi:molybdenum cofactor cytidylyltransferase